MVAPSASPWSLFLLASNIANIGDTGARVARVGASAALHDRIGGPDSPEDAASAGSQGRAPAQTGARCTSAPADPGRAHVAVRVERDEIGARAETQRAALALDRDQPRRAERRRGQRVMTIHDAPAPDVAKRVIERESGEPARRPSGSRQATPSLSEPLGVEPGGRAGAPRGRSIRSLISVSCVALRARREAQPVGMDVDAVGDHVAAEALLGAGRGERLRTWAFRPLRPDDASSPSR